jgi:hypothetical protein
MRRVLGTVLVALSVILATTTVVSAAGASPFNGSWSAVDVDGSRMTVTFAGTGATRKVTFVDFRATFCGGDAWQASGVGTVVGGDTIVVEFVGGCVGGSSAPGGATWSYDAASKTLTDGTLTWYRGDRVREAFIGAWRATDVDGSSMKLNFRGTGLTRQVSFFDDAVAFCAGASFAAQGIGIIGSIPGEGRLIRVSLHGHCPGTLSSFDFDWTYEYLYATDTLSDGSVTWHRP